MPRKYEDFLATLVESAVKTVHEGYYRSKGARTVGCASLSGAIREAKGTPVICEVKFVSPAEGRLREATGAKEIALTYEGAGAAAISVITEPKHFDGRLEYLEEVKRSVRVPVLMKDVIVDDEQIEAAARLGADAILLIEGIFRRRLTGTGLAEMIRKAHGRSLEVLLEVHSESEYDDAIQTEADLVGINNRDLGTLEVSLDTSRRILERHHHPKPVISESGLTSKAELDELRALGADGFLVGSAFMKARDPSLLIRSMVEG